MPEHDPREHHRGADDPEDAARVFAGGRLGEADRHEAGDGDQRARQARHRGRGVGEGGRLHAVPALLHLHHHHLDRDDRVVDQQAERDDQRAERDALEVPAHREHHHARPRRARAAPRCATTMPVRQPRLSRLTASTMASASISERSNSQTESLHGGRLVGDALELDAVRQLGLDLGDRALDRLAELDDVAVVGHRRCRASAPAGRCGGWCRSADPRSRA